MLHRIQPSTAPTTKLSMEMIEIFLVSVQIKWNESKTTPKEQ